MTGKTHKTENYAQAISMMNEHDLWELFAKTGDIELYMMYRAIKEREQHNGDGAL